jgi:hypothetical protein
VPVKRVSDRYTNIALALGTIDGVQKTRQQIFDINFARQLIRAQVKGAIKGAILDEADIASLKRKTWIHVDRIYRGGPGDDLESRQAIFTKDVIYHIGYRQMVEYITGQLDQKMTAADIFAYLSQAAFDPNNPKHRERLEQILSSSK